MKKKVFLQILQIGIYILINKLTLICIFIPIIYQLKTHLVISIINLFQISIS